MVLVLEWGWGKCTCALAMYWAIKGLADCSMLSRIRVKGEAEPLAAKRFWIRRRLWRRRWGRVRSVMLGCWVSKDGA